MRFCPGLGVVVSHRALLIGHDITTTTLMFMPPPSDAGVDRHRSLGLSFKARLCEVRIVLAANLSTRCPGRPNPLSRTRADRGHPAFGRRHHVNHSTNNADISSSDTESGLSIATTIVSYQHITYTHTYMHTNIRCTILPAWPGKNTSSLEHDELWGLWLRKGR